MRHFSTKKCRNHWLNKQQVVLIQTLLEEFKVLFSCLIFYFVIFYENYSMIKTYCTIASSVMSQKSSRKIWVWVPTKQHWQLQFFLAFSADQWKSVDFNSRTILQIKAINHYLMQKRKQIPMNKGNCQNYHNFFLRF